MENIWSRIIEYVSLSNKNPQDNQAVRKNIKLNFTLRKIHLHTKDKN